MSERDDNKPVGTDLYVQSITDVSALQTQLPEEVVFALARDVLEAVAQKVGNRAVSDETIVDLSHALIGADVKAAARRIEDRLRDGVDVDRLYLEYLGPASALLGKWWESDKITFADVTVGSGRIYAIMRSLHRRTTRPRVTEHRAAFFASIPDDDHTLGVKMAADLARKDGWEIDFELDASHEELIDRITRENHTLVGLSGGGEHAVPNMARLVFALRIHAPDTLIVVSGNVVRVAGKSVRLMHVDGIGKDYATAMNELDRLWKSAQTAQK